MCIKSLAVVKYLDCLVLVRWPGGHRFHAIFYIKIYLPFSYQLYELENLSQPPWGISMLSISEEHQDYRITGGLASLLKAILLHNHSTASCTPVPVSALQGNTRLSLILPPFSPSNTLRTNPSLILTTSTQSSLSCLFARISIGTPLASSFANTLSKTSLHSSSLPISSLLAALLALRSASVAFPTSLLSITKTMAWQLL